MPTWPSPRSDQLGPPNPPRNPFHAGQVFRGFPIHAFATACQVARSPVRIRPTRSAPGSFYFQAFNGSVALPVAGYDYNSDWTPLLAGLSPARMAASLAAPEPDLILSHHPARATARRLPPSIERRVPVGLVVPPVLLKEFGLAPSRQTQADSAVVAEHIDADSTKPVLHDRQSRPGP